MTSGLGAQLTVRLQNEDQTGLPLFNLSSGYNLYLHGCVQAFNGDPAEGLHMIGLRMYGKIISGLPLFYEHKLVGIDCAFEQFVGNATLFLGALRQCTLLLRQ